MSMFVVVLSQMVEYKISLKCPIRFEALLTIINVYNNNNNSHRDISEQPLWQMKQEDETVG